jgi:hypothetical protein
VSEIFHELRVKTFDDKKTIQKERRKESLNDSDSVVVRMLRIVGELANVRVSLVGIEIGLESSEVDFGREIILHSVLYYRSMNGRYNVTHVSRFH